MEISIELINAYIIVLALIFYALSGGADFGGGIWDLLAFGKSAEAQRSAISKAIGPIWEVNHVWVIFAAIVLLTSFPHAFSVLMTALFIPMFLILIGIVLRGAAFVFKKYDPSNDMVHKFWSPIFGASSFLAPFLLGISLGALASERIYTNVAQFDYFSAWLNPFALSCGLFAEFLFAYLAAVYLSAETKKDSLANKAFRIRAIISALCLAPIAALVYILAKDGAPYLFANLNSFWAPGLLLLTSICAIAALVCLIAKRFYEARILAATKVGSIIAGWAMAQYPYLITPNLSIYNSAAPQETMIFVMFTAIGGACILFPSIAYLFYIFKNN